MGFSERLDAILSRTDYHAVIIPAIRTRASRKSTARNQHQNMYSNDYIPNLKNSNAGLTTKMPTTKPPRFQNRTRTPERSASKQPPELQHRPAGVYIVSAERNMRICIDTLLMKMLYDGRPYCPRSH